MLTIDKKRAELAELEAYHALYVAAKESMPEWIPVAVRRAVRKLEETWGP